MLLPYKTRKRWSLFLLLVGMPAYIGFAWWITSLFDTRPHVLIELVIYIALGVVWILPFKFVFLGVGKADPDAPPEE
ncbi:MAG: DUF2842 domain-containing protein [Rhodobacteraceae bacterium]|nr:DUF2842 domain-containing protein [Paracoccaceae bacterium]